MQANGSKKRQFLYRRLKKDPKATNEALTLAVREKFKEGVSQTTLAAVRRELGIVRRTSRSSLKAEVVPPELKPHIRECRKIMRQHGVARLEISGNRVVCGLSS